MIVILIPGIFLVIDNEEKKIIIKMKTDVFSNLR